MLIKTFKILQTLCAVYGWEVVNNHVRSGKSMDNPITQASLSAERFDLRHPCPTQSRELAAINDTTPWTAARQASISLGTWEYINQCIWNIEKEI